MQFMTYAEAEQKYLPPAFLANFCSFSPTRRAPFYFPGFWHSSSLYTHTWIGAKIDKTIWHAFLEKFQLDFDWSGFKPNFESQ